MNEELLKELGTQYAQNVYCSDGNDTPQYKIAQIHAGRDGFIYGAKYIRNSAWHTDKEPFYEREDKQVLILGFRKGEFLFSAIEYAEEYNTFIEKNKFRCDSFMYSYIEELLPINK